MQCHLGLCGGSWLQLVLLAPSQVHITLDIATRILR